LQTSQILGPAEEILPDSGLKHSMKGKEHKEDACCLTTKIEFILPNLQIILKMCFKRNWNTYSESKSQNTHLEALTVTLSPFCREEKTLKAVM